MNSLGAIEDHGYPVALPGTVSGQFLDKTVPALFQAIPFQNPELGHTPYEVVAVDYNPHGSNPRSKVQKKGNLAQHLKIVRGDVKSAFKECAVIVEDDFTTPWVEHGYLETESGIAYPSDDGGVVLKIGTQNAFGDREQLSEILGLPEDKIRIIQLPMGGAFGAKEDILLHQHLALGAYLTGKPVKMVLTREESRPPVTRKL